MTANTFFKSILIICFLFIESKLSGQSWSQKANISNTTSTNMSFSVNGKGYLLLRLSNNFLEYNPSTNTWTSKAAFPGLTREIAACFSIGEKGYISTGVQSNGSQLADLWEYNTVTNTWTQKTDFPGGGRYAAVGFSIGNKGYVGMGFDNIAGSLKNDFWEYNPAVNAWTQRADFGAGVRGFAAGFSIGVKGYVGTGASSLDNTGLQNDFWEYDPGSNSWSQKANFPGLSRGYALGFSIGTKGYLGTGSGDIEGGPGPYYHDLWEYNASTNSWTSKPDYPGTGSFYLIGFSIGTNGYVGGGEGGNFFSDFWQFSNPAGYGGTWVIKEGVSPTARRGEASAVVNNIIYVVGGAPPNSTGSLTTVEAYDPSTNTWTTKAPMLLASQQLIAQSINGIVYAVAGGGCCGAYSDVQAYDPVTNTWSYKTPAPTPRYGASSAVANNKLYVFSGGSGYGISYQNLEEYDPILNTWATKAPMPFFRSGCATATVNGIIYAIGGSDAAGIFYGTVQAYDPSTNSWSIKTAMPTPRAGVKAAVIGDKIYVIGGLNNTAENLYTVEIYNPVTDTWEAGPPLATLLYYNSLNAATVSGRIYAIGGMPPQITQNLSVEEFTPCSNTTSSITVTACNQYLWNGVLYTTSGDKTYTTTNAAGCDSVATLHLTINRSSASSTTLTACDQYLWNGVVYTTSGDKTYTTTNAAGCDSIATLHLTINHSSASSTTVTACDQYLWNGVLYTTSGDKTFTTTNAAGCDSIATLHLTINRSSASSTTVTACDQYLWNGVLYTTSGDKTYTTTNTAGCDSLATLHLTIINGPTAPIITCPSGSPFIRGTNASCKYTIVGSEFNATATATCGTPSLSFVLTGVTTGSGNSTLSGLVLNKGITTITWTATNGSLTNTCSLNVNVIDNLAPVVTCPGNSSITLKGKNNCNAKLKTANPTYSDNCGVVTTLTWIKSGATSGISPATGINYAGTQIFNTGITTITYTATDASGNTATCSFTVTITNPNCIVAPAINFNPDMVKENPSSQSELTIKVNPNPSTTYFELNISSNKTEKIQIIIMDITGRVLQKQYGSPNRSYRIGNKLIAGTYIVEVRQGDQRKVSKIIKQ